MNLDADAVLGGGLPPEAQDRIARAGACRHDLPLALALLDEAEALAPGHPAVLIARYRLHFYGHRLEDARDVAREALRCARQGLKRDVIGAVDTSPVPTDEQARFDAAVRFYLFSLKGYAYLSLRLGDVDAGRLALDELRRLDPQDRVGGSVLAHVLTMQEADADVDADAQASRQAPRGWSIG